MNLKILGGNKHGRIQNNKLERPTKCFETIAGMQSTKAPEYFGQINRINLPRDFTSTVGVELHLLDVPSKKAGELYLEQKCTTSKNLFSCLDNYKEETI